MSALTYCQSHDLFDCWLGHPASFPAESLPVEDLDAPTLTPAEIDAMRTDFTDRRRAADGRVILTVFGDVSGVAWELVGSFGPGAYLARSDRTGTLVRVDVTSRNLWQTKIRVRFTACQDHGYADGRVTFDGDEWKGWGYRASLVAAGLVTD